MISHALLAKLDVSVWIPLSTFSQPSKSNFGDQTIGKFRNKQDMSYPVSRSVTVNICAKDFDGGTRLMVRGPIYRKRLRRVGNFLNPWTQGP